MLSRDFENQLREIVGPERYLNSREDVLSASYDAFVVENAADAVIYPQTTEEVSQIMKIAWAENIPVTARGSGTNICGASVPASGGLVVSFTKMNRILEINTRDRYAVVQPGVINGDLQKALEPQNFFYPPDPGSVSVSTIGGNVAQNAGGPHCLKYGVTVDYVLSLEVVLPNGDVIRFGSRNVKDVTGYKLSALFCGSEGTLGLVTEITLRVVPLPEARCTILAVFDDLDRCADTVSNVICSGIIPAAMELMDKVVINAVEDAYHLDLPRQAEGTLLIEIDGVAEGVEKEMAVIARKARENGAVEIKEARSRAESDRLWQARRAAYSVFARLSPTCVVEDATVPVSQVPKMVRGIREIALRYDLKVGILAHAGDGNMHPLISTDFRNKEEWERVEQANEEIFKLAVSLGGTLSGEHGIGLAKSKYLGMVMNEATRNFTQAVKKAVDPRGILNPGKFV